DRELKQRLGDATREYGSVAPPQEVVVQFDDMARAFWQLSPHHREILMLAGANGLSYEEAAKVVGCAVGTVRSRLSRARAELQAVLDRREGPRAMRRNSMGKAEFLKLLRVAA